MSTKENDVILEALHEATAENEDYARDLDEWDRESIEERAEAIDYQGYDR